MYFRPEPRRLTSTCTHPCYSLLVQPLIITILPPGAPLPTSLGVAVEPRHDKHMARCCDSDDQQEIPLASMTSVGGQKHASELKVHPPLKPIGTLRCHRACTSAALAILQEVMTLSNLLEYS